jgi:hypothetical protein
MHSRSPELVGQYRRFPPFCPKPRATSLINARGQPRLLQLLRFASPSLPSSSSLLPPPLTRRAPHSALLPPTQSFVVVFHAYSFAPCWLVIVRTSTRPSSPTFTAGEQLFFFVPQHSHHLLSTLRSSSFLCFVQCRCRRAPTVLLPLTTSPWPASLFQALVRFS